MDQQQRDELRERNRRRATACSRCGSSNIHEYEGRHLSPETHFAELLYKVCVACGHEDVKRPTARRK